MFFQKESERLLFPDPAGNISSHAAAAHAAAAFRSWAEGAGVSLGDANVVMNVLGSLDKIISSGLDERVLDEIPVEQSVKRALLQFFGSVKVAMDETPGIPRNSMGMDGCMQNDSGVAHGSGASRFLVNEPQDVNIVVGDTMTNSGADYDFYFDRRSEQPGPSRLQPGANHRSDFIGDVSQNYIDPRMHQQPVFTSRPVYRQGPPMRHATTPSVPHQTMVHHHQPMQSSHGHMLRTSTPQQLPFTQQYVRSVRQRTTPQGQYLNGTQNPFNEFNYYGY